MTTAPIVTYGFNTYDFIHSNYTTYGTGFLITGGFSSRGAALFERVISALEKKNVSVCWIDSRYIEPGLADHTIFDELIERLES